MAAEFTVRISAGAQEVHQVLRDGMSHVELVSEDVLRVPNGTPGDETYVAVLLYQHFFMRVGNQVALMLLVSGDSQMTRVKSVACASSQDILLKLDLGAAGDFASEPINLLQEHYRGRIWEA